MENRDEEHRMLEAAGWEPREREDGETVWKNPATELFYPQGQAAAMVREGADPAGPQPGVKD